MTRKKDDMIDRRTLSATLIAAVATGILANPGKAQTQRPIMARNVVLVHGAYADGSCRSEVIGRLQPAGLTATAVQNPLTSLADDVAAPSVSWHCRMGRPCWLAIPGPAR